MEGNGMERTEDMASVSDFDPLAGSIPATKVEITVSCRNLLDKDAFSKSDPLCVLYTQGIETKQWREYSKHSNYPRIPATLTTNTLYSVPVWSFVMGSSVWHLFILLLYSGSHLDN